MRYDNHMEKHHTKKFEHKCSYCKHYFKRQIKLKNHIFKAHPEKVQEYKRKSQVNLNIKSSIFHNVELLALSDSQRTTILRREDLNENEKK